MRDERDERGEQNGQGGRAGAMDVMGVGTVAMDVTQRVDELPTDDGFALVREAASAPGGSAANVVVQAARLGAACGFAAAVGDDEAGRAFVRGFVDEGVGVAGLVTRPHATTTRATVTVADDGAHFVTLDMGTAFFTLHPDELPADAIRAARALYTDLLPREASLAALRAARDAGVRTVVGVEVGLPLMRAFGWDDDALREALSLADTALPCRAALAGLVGDQDDAGTSVAHGIDADADAVRRRAIALLVQTGAGEVVVTRGAAGAVGVRRREGGRNGGHAASGGERRAADDGNVEVVEVPAAAHPVGMRVTDTTGAGDSFAGAYLVARHLQGRDLRSSMAYAARCAALTVCGHGARSFPTVEDCPLPD